MNLSKGIFPQRNPGRQQAIGRLLVTYVCLPGFIATMSIATAQRQPHTPEIGLNPKPVWTFSSTAPIISSPVIDGSLVYFGADDSTWYALEAATGKMKWKIKTNAAIRSTPLVKGDHVYLAGGNGVLTCANKVTGTVAWRTVFDHTALFMGERTYDFADYYHSSPIIDNGVLYLATGNGVMSAYQAATGQSIWRFAAGDIVHSVPVIVGNLIVFGCFDGHVLALDKSDGSLAWKFKTIGHQYFPKGEVQGLLATDGKRVFVGARDYNFYAIDATSGRAVWNIRFTNGWAMSATVADTVVYIGTSDDRVMVAADSRNGQELWRTDVRFNTFGGCAVTGGSLWFGTIWGKAYGLDRRTGAITWTFETQGFREHHLRYFDEQDHFRPDVANLLRSPYAWIAAEHRLGGIFSTPAVGSGYMVITTTEGKVYGFRL